jgi:hypothetical protein
VIEIVPSISTHIAALATSLRREDVAELEAAGLTAQQALARSCERSYLARTAFVDGEVGAMWGLGGSPLAKVGRPWLLTGAPVEGVKVSFLRIARAELTMMLACHAELRGYVDARYARALRLLLVLGFGLSDEFPFGPRGMPFRQYSMRRRG